MRAVILGAAGQLGGATVARLIEAGHEVVALTRREVDLADAPALVEAVVAAKPDVIVNCAAYNQVDQAEDDPVPALQVNALAPRALAHAAARLGATLVHYGTDFVFDGTASAPYVETDAPAPQSVYGSSKLLGDWFAAQAPAHYVLRVESLFGGPRVRSSVDKIIGALQRGEEATVFTDRVVSPSYVEDVVTATLGLLAARAPYGLYHCVNAGVTTWQALAEEIARRLGVAARLVPVRLADVPMKARRPQYCALSNEKLARAGSPMPSWQDAIGRYLSLLRAGPGVTSQAG